MRDLPFKLVVQHRDRLRHLKPDNKETRRVQNLVEERRKLVEEKTAQVNRLIGYLKVYFPQMLEWFARLATKLVCEWIRIVFRCWQDRVAYDENKYLLALAKRGSPLNSVLLAATTTTV